MKVIVDGNNRITIPQKYRHNLDITKGHILNIDYADNDKLVIRKCASRNISKVIINGTEIKTNLPPDELCGLICRVIDLLYL